MTPPSTPKGCVDCGYRLQAVPYDYVCGDCIRGAKTPAYLVYTYKARRWKKLAPRADLPSLIHLVTQLLGDGEQVQTRNVPNKQ